MSNTEVNLQTNYKLLKHLIEIYPNIYPYLI